MKEKGYEADQIFRALGDKHRLRILDLLMEQERNAGELLEMLDVVQSTLSHHMKSLCEAGLVAARKEGKWTYYSIAPEAMRVASKFMDRYHEGTVKKSEAKAKSDKPSEKKRAVKGTADKPAEKKRAAKKTTLAHQSKNAEDIFDTEQKKRQDKEHEDVWAPVKTEEKAGKGNTKKDKKAPAKAGKTKNEKGQEKKPETDKKEKPGKIKDEKVKTEKAAKTKDGKERPDKTKDGKKKVENTGKRKTGKKETEANAVKTEKTGKEKEKKKKDKDKNGKK